MELRKELHYGFMAGCSLSSYHPNAVYEMAKYLSEQFPHFSVIQRCCGKPTKAMGQVRLFEQRFSSLELDVEEMGIDVLIVACQNCYRTIMLQGSIHVISLWDVLKEVGIPPHARNIGIHDLRLYTIHDSCPTREVDSIHDSVRSIIDAMGYQLKESQASRRDTLCCGAGGMAMSANKEMAYKMRQKRMDSLERDTIIVYCASCKNTLSYGDCRVWHILDLIYPRRRSKKSPKNVLDRPLLAWVNRYRCKAKLKKV